MKLALLLASACLLSGCAGLNTDWRLQLDMRYSTPEDKPAPIPAGKPA